MTKQFFEDKIYENADLLNSPLVYGEYDKCTFTGCDLSNAELSKFHFSQCVFKDCNFSLAKITQTSFQGIKFINCKMLGLHFFTANPFMFEVDFKGCNLSLSSFFKLNLKKRSFDDCILHEVDFTEADLSSASLNNCDCQRTIFRDCNLMKADFTSAFNYSIDPEANKIKGAKFSATGIAGLLDKYDLVIK